MTDIKVRDILDALALKIDFPSLNNMYSSNYKYTLNKYRELLRLMILESLYKDKISNALIDKYLLDKIYKEYSPYVNARILDIAAIPMVEQKSPEWFKLREGMISASDAGYFLKKCGAARATDTLRIKLGLKNYVNSTAPPLMHGNTYEDITRAIYESRNKVEVTEYGIITSRTVCIGASPDGIITKCLDPSWECQSRLGRLLEIKNPYSREIDNTVKPEYMVQILQQQYTTILPVCDFVETTIVDKYCKTNGGNYKPYETIDEMLADQLDKSNINCFSRIKNHNIPNDNLNKFGNEKGLIVWYQKQVAEGDVRNKYILYPLSAPYVKSAIEKWIIDKNSEQFKTGFSFREVKLWRLDVYSEKTVVYDQCLFEKQYIPQLCDVWGVITKCRELQLNNKNGTGNAEIEKYIEDLENRKDSPFYNENKRKKKLKYTNSNATASTTSLTSMSTGEGADIELDF
jgi:hypothetical protein